MGIDIAARAYTVKDIEQDSVLQAAGVQTSRDGLSLIDSEGKRAYD